MSWTRGSKLAEDIWKNIRQDIPEAKQQRVARYIVMGFDDAGADGWENMPGSLLYLAYPERCRREWE